MRSNFCVAIVVSTMVVLVGACGGDTAKTAEPERSATPSEHATSDAARGEPIVLRTSVSIAAAPGAEVIATGDVLKGSTLGGSPFCVGGTILDTHGSSDPEVWLIARTITCPEGTVRMEFTPDEPEGLRQTGSWTILSGTGEFKGLSGSGKLEVAYDQDPEAPAHETYTGTATR